MSPFAESLLLTCAIFLVFIFIALCGFWGRVSGYIERRERTK
jgi:hypothetical protein